MHACTHTTTLDLPHAVCCECLIDGLMQVVWFYLCELECVSCAASAAVYHVLIPPNYLEMPFRGKVYCCLLIASVDRDEWFGSEKKSMTQTGICTCFMIWSGAASFEAQEPWVWPSFCQAFGKLWLSLPLTEFSSVLSVVISYIKVKSIIEVFQLDLLSSL